MEVENGDDIPGLTGQGACAETAPVVSKMRDDPFDDLVGKPTGGRCHRWYLRKSTRRAHSPDSDQAWVPNSPCRQSNRCDQQDAVNS